MQKSFFDRLLALERGNESGAAGTDDLLRDFAELCGTTIPLPAGTRRRRALLDLILTEMPERFAPGVDMAEYWRGFGTRELTADESAALRGMFEKAARWAA